MKSTSVKGLPSSGKTFAKYTGNVKSTGKLPGGERKTPAGGKVASNMKKTAVRKKLGGK